MLSKWVSQTNRKNFTPTLYSRLCSEHFVAEDYQIRPGASVKLLKDDAFPSVFKSAPGHLQKKLLAKHKRLAILQTHTVNIIKKINSNVYIVITIFNLSRLLNFFT